MTCTKNGTWSEECVGEIKPSKEICDGLADENCDGKSDQESCTCIYGKDELPCGKFSLGICKKGSYPCTKEGEWDKSECVGEVRPRKEICDGLGEDEDCDGLADLKDPDCQCINGTVGKCTVPGKRGDCALGRKACINGKWSGICSPRFEPETEFCGSRHNPDPGLPEPTGDEDCDGLFNESDVGNHFNPKGGDLYMKDEDGDGWGDQDERTLRRYCPNKTVDRDYIPFNSNRQHDCGDCRLDGKDVNPDHKDFEKKDSDCLKRVRWSGGAFDWNCSGSEDKEYPKAMDCYENSEGKCVPDEGIWHEVVPKCGDQGGLGWCGFGQPTFRAEKQRDRDKCGGSVFSPEVKVQSCK